MKEFGEMKEQRTNFKLLEIKRGIPKEPSKIVRIRAANSFIAI
jgi:hypothetical protein